MMSIIKKLIVSTILASISVCSLSGIQVFAQDNLNTTTKNSITPRYTYVTSSNIEVSVSSSGASYSLYIKGTSEVTKISGTLTLYKDDKYVSSKRISENSNKVDTSGTLTASGRGSYELIFNGTVSTRNGSEPITISEIQIL